MQLALHFLVLRVHKLVHLLHAIDQIPGRVSISKRIYTILARRQRGPVDVVQVPQVDVVLRVRHGSITDIRVVASSGIPQLNSPRRQGPAVLLLV